MKKVTLHNDYHGTSVVVSSKAWDAAVSYYYQHNGKLNPTAKRIKQALCGEEDCTCGNWCGLRGDINEAL